MNNLSLLTKVLKRYPVPVMSKANIAVTYRCNQRCLTCNIWKANTINSKRKEEEIDLTELTKIVLENKLIWLSFTGGEPFLNEHLDNMMSWAASAVNIISITTNGSQPVIIHNIIRHAVRFGDDCSLLVNVSINGDKEIHNKIAGIDGSFEHAVQTIDKLVRINHKNLIVNIEHTISRFNEGQYKNIEVLADFYKVNLVYNAEQNASYYDNVETKINGNIKIPEHLDTRFNINSIMNRMFIDGARKEKQRRCVACQYSCFVDPYCNVYPCLFTTPMVKLKSMRQDGFQFNDVRKSALRTVVNQCKGCWTPCETYTTMLFRPWKVL